MLCQPFACCQPRPLASTAACRLPTLLLYSTPGSTAQTVQGWYQSCSLGRTQLTSQSSQVSTAVSW
jgi:hypothetical protein